MNGFIPINGYIAVLPNVCKEGTELDARFKLNDNPLNRGIVVGPEYSVFLNKEILYPKNVAWHIMLDSVVYHLFQESLIVGFYHDSNEAMQETTNEKIISN